MSRLEKHIAEYAKAIEDMDWGRRSLFHRELCEHLGIAHDELRPFESFSFGAGYSHTPSRAEAAMLIRAAIDKLKERRAEAKP